MPEHDIKRFIEEIKTSSLRHFSTSTKAEPSILYSGEGIQINVDRSDIPVPQLVRFVLAFILKLPIYGPGEKVRWEIPFIYKGFPCTFALQKFGLRLYVSGGGIPLPDTKKVALEIIKKMQKSIQRVEKNLLIPFAKEQIENGHITIINQYHTLMNRYVYFREKAKEASKREKEFRAKDIKELTKSYSDMLEAKNKLFYNTIAMLDAYFSFLEHLFVLVMPLSRDNIRLLDFIASFWADKYKQLFDIISNSRAKSFYDKLDSIKEQFRNFWAHGAFEKGGTSLYIHVPNIGAIPAQFSRVKNNPHFSFFPVQEDNFKDICRTIDDFEKWLQSEESGLAKAITYVESGLDVPCDKQSLERIRSAMTSDKKLEALIQGDSYLWAMHANMDY